MAATLADDTGEIGLRIIIFAFELLIAERFLKRVEIGALNIFDNGKFERLLVVRFDKNDRHVMQPGTLCGAPAPFAGDDLVNVCEAGDSARKDRLDDALLADRGDEVFEILIVESLARIARIGPQECERNLSSGRASARSPPLPLRRHRSAPPARGRAAAGILLPYSPPSYSLNHNFKRALMRRAIAARAG